MTLMVRMDTDKNDWNTDKKWNTDDTDVTDEH
jgi:hypothetical protein